MTHSSSNPNQTHLNKLIKVFRINRKLQAGEFLSRATSRARASDIQNLKCVKKNIKRLNFHIQTPARLTARVIKLIKSFFKMVHYTDLL